jgi:tetrapyrrole methylase family protein / MazG family protein
MNPSKLKETGRLLKVVGELRRKCPWDRKQTHQTLSQYMLEEAYETVDAIEGKKPDALREELGDVLLQVALHSEIASEKGKFSFEDVARSITDKMIRRHPDIYEKARTRDMKDHLRNWTRLKSLEKPKRGRLEGIPRALPSLQRAQRYGEIASSVGFDWKDSASVLAKARAEIKKLEAESQKKKPDVKKLADDFGDLMFALGNFGRHLGLDAEAAARTGAQKFADRFSRAEQALAATGKPLAECSRKDWDAAWKKAKSKAKRS